MSFTDSDTPKRLWDDPHFFISLAQDGSPNALKRRYPKSIRSFAHPVIHRSLGLPPLKLPLDKIFLHSEGEFADLWWAKRDFDEVRVRAFRTSVRDKTDKIKRKFYRDVEGWKQLNHPNVVPFLEVFEKRFQFCIVSPWQPGGDICEYVDQHQDAKRFLLLAQAACGLAYLHSLRIVHGGINPGNILIDGNGVARLADFGITGLIIDMKLDGCTMVNKFGNVRYMAPELFLSTQEPVLSGESPTECCDIYSFAMTIYEVLSGVTPYGSAFESWIIIRVILNERPPRPADTRWIPDDIWRMIQACWDKRPEKRYTIREVLETIAEDERGDRIPKGASLLSKMYGAVGLSLEGLRYPSDEDYQANSGW